MRGNALYLLIALSIFLFIGIPSDAGGAGGIKVEQIRVCLDGAILTGEAEIPETLNRFFRGAILRGHVGWGTPDYVGRTQIFSAINETRHFLIQYPETTFFVGEAVTLSVLAQDISGYGGGAFTRAIDCHIADFMDASQIPVPLASPINPIRIQFATGTTSATIHDELQVGENVDYVLGALAGQTMTVNLISSSNQAFLAISHVDTTVLLDSAYVQNSWTGMLPANGDYYIQVISDAIAENYSIEIIIPPAPSHINYTQYQQTASNRVAFSNALKSALFAHDYDALPAMMQDPFNLGFWGSEGASPSVSEMREHLRSDLLPPTGIIEFPDVEVGSVTPGVNLFQLFPWADSFIYSRGWGLDGNTEVIIVLSQITEDVFIWDSLLIASGGFTPTNVVASATPTPCNFEWFFTPVPEYCPLNPPSVSDAVIQYFEGGLMIWFANNDSIYVIPTNGLWYAYPDTWNEGMPLSTLSETPPEGLFMPIRGFGLVWQQSNYRAQLGWATGAEFAVQITSQCDDHIRTYACYYDTPGGIIQLRGQALWTYWG